MRSRLTSCLVACAAACAAASAEEPSQARAALLSLFAEWREAQRPPVKGGVPDYTPPALERQRHGLDALRARLDAIDPAGLAPPERIDRTLVSPR